eukprot:evm.model.scf_298.15 EVM.evm.TU.scf_298.15   scf_298:98636-98992(+)
MGNIHAVYRYDNDFELTVRAAKELEHMLEHDFGAQGQGLHQKINAVQEAEWLPLPLVQKMRHIATVRNKLVHEHGYNSIPNRDLFIRNFEESRRGLQKIASPMGRWTRKKELSICVIA